MAPPSPCPWSRCWTGDGTKSRIREGRVSDTLIGILSKETQRNSKRFGVPLIWTHVGPSRCTHSFVTVLIIAQSGLRVALQARSNYLELPPYKFILIISNYLESANHCI